VKDAKVGIRVAGGQGEGQNLTHLSHPQGVLVDAAGTVYVADRGNHRVMGWRAKAIHGIVVAGGNQYGGLAIQFNLPNGLSFDRHGNLYVTDLFNSRVQRFSIEKN
jgi:sugar lactone lactonase YvrE